MSGVEKFYGVYMKNAAYAACGTLLETFEARAGGQH